MLSKIAQTTGSQNSSLKHVQCTYSIITATRFVCLFVFCRYSLKFCYFPVHESFQKAINCISVPRCCGDLLWSFRSLLITTARLLKASNLCPDLEYNHLKRYLKGKTALNFFNLDAIQQFLLTEFTWPGTLS